MLKWTLLKLAFCKNLKNGTRIHIMKVEPRAKEATKKKKMAMVTVRKLDVHNNELNV